MPTPVPKFFALVHDDHFVVYQAREGFDTSDGIRYDYDWSHTQPRTDD